jgi:two-component system, sensor histidine kinase and response regulator
MHNSGKFLLIVDDNLKNLKLTATLLKDEGFLLSLAQDAGSALMQLETLTPDLILLDVMMPGMDGLELCREIKKNEKFTDTPVIFLTARDQAEDLAEGFRAGGVDYITKPFNREELLIRIRNQLELAHSKKRLIEMNRTRDRLYSIISHDIRSPFSNIILTLNSIAGGFLDISSYDFMDIIRNLEKSAQETKILLDNLLDWTSLQSDDLKLKMENSRIYQVINQSVHLLQSNAESKKISIDNAVPHNIYAYFDRVSMYAVFRNILYNAIKFTPEGGKISIATRTEKDYVVVSISDTGVGMDEDTVRRIFRENEHITTEGTNNERGSGLGTFIIKDFVNRNRGRLEVFSFPGKGTTLSVWLNTDKPVE